MEAKNQQVFIQKAEQYASAQLKGETMTLAELFRNEGLEKGIEKGRQQGAEKTRQEMAARLLKEGIDPRVVARVTECAVEDL